MPSSDLTEELKRFDESAATLRTVLARVEAVSPLLPIERSVHIETVEYSEAQRLAAAHTVEEIGVLLSELHQGRSKLAERMIRVATELKRMEERRATLDRAARILGAAIAFQHEAIAESQKNET